VSYGVYSAEIEWDSAIRTVLASELGDECLICMRLLSGYDLRIQVKPRGMMEANKMP
jgi:predicted aspartyl protease